MINLNRFRKKKAREEKERRAETNRRFHGRTKAERAREETEKQRLEKKIDGAFLVREMVGLEDVPGGDDSGDFEKLEAATRDVMSLKEFSALLSGDEALLSGDAARDGHESEVEKNAESLEDDSDRADPESP